MIKKNEWLETISDENKSLYRSKLIQIMKDGAMTVTYTAQEIGCARNSLTDFLNEKKMSRKNHNVFFKIINYVHWINGDDVSLAKK